MIKLIGFSALTLGFIEWLYDFKLNGWNFATVLSIIVVFERLHHNHQMRFMLYQIGIKVGVEWSSLQPRGLKYIYPKLFGYLQKDTKRLNRIRRKKKMMQFLRSNISKKLLALLVGIGVTALNKKFNLQLSPDETLVILLAALGYITGQSYVDGRKAIASTVTAVSQVVHTSTGVTADKTYKDLFPTIKTVHEGINNLLADVQKNDASQAFKDAASAYLSIMDIIKSIQQPEPLPEIQQESA